MTTPQSCYFLGKNNFPQWIPTLCFETTLHELLKSTFKEKHDCGTNMSKVGTDRKLSPFGTWKFQKKCKILQQNN